MHLVRKIVLIGERLIKKIICLTELILLLRLLLKFLDASPKAFVVGTIYKYTDILLSPFNLIFENIYWRQRLIETAAISAMVGYLILGFILARILRTFSGD